MVVSEKGLLRAMKEAYNGSGYKIACQVSGGRKELMIGYPGWAVVITMKNVPRKVLGLIAEHLGQIPEEGEAFQVSRKQTQTAILDVAMGIIREMDNEEKERYKVKPTDMVMNGYRLWQREKDYTVVRVDPDREAIMLANGRTVWLFDEDTMMVDGMASRVYIGTSYAPGVAAALSHLSKLHMVSF